MSSVWYCYIGCEPPPISAQWLQDSRGRVCIWNSGTSETVVFKDIWFILHMYTPGSRWRNRVPSIISPAHLCVQCLCPSLLRWFCHAWPLPGVLAPPFSFPRIFAKWALRVLQIFLLLNGNTFPLLHHTPSPWQPPKSPVCVHSLEQGGRTAVCIDNCT